MASNGTVAQCTKLLLASHLSTSSSATTLLPTQLPTSVPGKATEDDPGAANPSYLGIQLADGRLLSP